MTMPEFESGASGRSKSLSREPDEEIASAQRALDSALARVFRKKGIRAEVGVPIAVFEYEGGQVAHAAVRFGSKNATSQELIAHATQTAEMAFKDNQPVVWRVKPTIERQQDEVLSYYWRAAQVDDETALAGLVLGITVCPRPDNKVLVRLVQREAVEDGCMTVDRKEFCAVMRQVIERLEK